MKKVRFIVDSETELTPDQQAVFNGILIMVLVSFVLFIFGVGALFYAYMLINGHAA